MRNKIENLLTAIVFLETMAARGCTGFDRVQDAKGARRGGYNLVNPSGKNVTANDETFALAA